MAAVSSFKNKFAWWLIVLSLLLFFCSIREVGGNFLKDTRKCGKPTCIVDKKFGFSPSMIYTYKYSINVNTSFDGPDITSSSLMIDSEFELHFLSLCEGVLLIKSATLLDDPDKYNLVDEESSYEFDSDDSSYKFSKAIKEFPLRFYLESGTVKEVCPHSQESNWVANFKKGILSAFQNTMKRFDVDHKETEVDVNGNCDTRYMFDSVNGTTLLITRNKDISSCSQRHTLHSVMPTSSFTFQSKYHRWSPLSSTVKCKQYVDHKIYTEIKCVEEHSFQPFYNQTTDKLSTTSVTQDILLVNEDYTVYGTTNFELEDFITRRESLLFHHHVPVNLDVRNLKIAEDHSKAICKLEEGEFNPDILEEYNKLIGVCRQLSYEDLTQLVKLSTSLCESGKKHMFQALPHLQTGPAVRVMTDIINSGNEIPSKKAHEWLISMALFRRHNVETMKAVSSLLNKNADMETFLSVSAIIHSYCRIPGNMCENDVIINDMISLFEDHVKNTCYNYKDFKKGIVGLKSLGNAGIFTDGISELLNACILKDSLPTEIRVAAVESHRRFSCDYDREFLLSVYMNQTLDAELRIAAYLEAMKCPSYSVLKTVKESLEKEEVNQVGSFVWSHIQNMMKSAMDSALEIQAILQDEYLSSKFSSDVMKFSQNYESSLYVNEYGTGGFLSSNVIFSHKSYIPRSLTTNFTFFLFGESVNFFEMTINLEGFEEYFESLFRSGKLFSFSKIELPAQLLRFIRNTPTSLKEKIDAIPNVIKDKFVNTKISAGFKIFGHELIYIDVDGKEKFDEVLEKLNPLKLVKDFFSGQEVKLDRLGFLFDSSYVTPLGIGLPLNLDTTAVAALNVNMAGFLNMTSFSSHRFLDFEGKLKPSLALCFIGRMDVNAFYKETSIKLKSKVVSSTALEGSFKMESSRYVRFSFNLPKNKSDIFSIETKFVTLRGSKVVPVKGVTAGLVENKICSWPLLDEVLGLKVCTNFLFPNAVNVLKAPILLLKGPLKFGISLEKSDPSAKTYILEYKKQDAENKTVITAVFETPGSIVKRTMKATINLDDQTQNLTLLVKSESNSLHAEGFYRHSPTDRSLNFGLDINGKKHVDVQMSLLSTRAKHGYTYEPKLLFAINGKRIANLTGSFRWVEKGGVSQCAINLNFNTNRFEGLLSGYVVLKDASFSTNLKMLYKFEKSDQETLKLKLTYGDRSTKYVTKHIGSIQLESTAYPHINFLFSLKYQKAHEHLECNIEMQTSPSMRDDKNKLYMQLIFTYLKTPTGSKVNSYLQIKKPANDIDIKLGFSHEVLSGATNTVAMVRYASSKEIKISLDLKLPRGTMFYLEGKLRINLPTGSEPMVVTLHIHENKPKEYDIDFTGIWFSGHNITIRGMYINRSNYLFMNHNIKLSVKGHLFNDVLIMGRFYSSDEEYKIDLEVEHNNIKYVLIMRHFYQRNILIETYGEVQYNLTSYTISNYIDLVKHKAQIELHLDKYRDIRIALHGTNKHTTLDVGCDIKWDANRDPSQKLVLLLNFNSFGNLNYKAKLMSDYPGRVINAAFQTEHKGVNYMASTKIDWSPTDSFDISLWLMWDLRQQGIINFKSTVSTPFEGWQSSSLDFGFHWLSYGVISNATLKWMKDQIIIIGLDSKYIVNEKIIDLSFDAGVNSTTRDIRPMRAKISHHQANGMYESVILIQSSLDNTVRFNSNGYINGTVNVTDLKTSVSLRTPYATLSNFQLDVEVKVYVGNKIKSNVFFNINDKRFSTIMKGSFKKFYESKLLFKMLTPYEKYNKLYGRFGFSASNKHFIIEVKGPVTVSGIEILYVFNNIYDFDLKLHVFTGINFISDTIIVGKLNSENADFRCGWNKLMVGLTGKTHYVSYSDLDYSLILYLPVETFNKIGVVTKVLYTDRLDLVATIISADRKIGLTAQAMKHPDFNFAQYKSSLMDEEMMFMKDDIFEDDVTDFYNLGGNKKRTIWRGIFQLDPGFYNSSKGYIEICYERQANRYVDYDITCSVELPVITVHLKDVIHMQHLINMTNELSVETTNSLLLQELKLFYECNGIVDELKANLHGSLTSFNKSHDFQLATNYTFHPLKEGPISDGSGRHEVIVFAQTPFAAFNSCNVEFSFEMDRNTYESDLNMHFNEYEINVGGVLVVEESDFFNSTLGLKVISPTIFLPVCKIHIAKDFTEVEKKINAYLILPGDTIEVVRNYSIGGSWLYGGPNYLKFLGHLHTPKDDFKDIDTSFSYSYDDVGKDHFVEMYLRYAVETEMKIVGQIHDNANATLKITSTVKALRSVQIDGFIKDTGNGVYNFEAALGSETDYQLFGWATKNPKMMEMKITKKDHSSELVSMAVNIKEANKKYEFTSVIQQLEDRFDISCDLTAVAPYAKLFNVQMSSTYPGFEFLMLSGHLLSSDPQITLLKLNGQTKSEWLETYFDWKCNTWLDGKKGLIDTTLDSKQVNVVAKVEWVWEWMRNIWGNLVASYTYNKMTKDISTKLHLWNPKAKFEQLSFGTDISLNSKTWWLSSNVSVIAPNYQDMAIAVDVLLPHDPEIHSLIAKLQHSEKVSYYNHIFSYSTIISKKNYQFISEVQKDDRIHGLLYANVTSKSSFYLLDRYNITGSGITTGNTYDIRNSLKTNYMQNEILTRVVYEKPSTYHKILVHICYPPPVTVVSADIQFESTNNVFAYLNGTTPFQNFQNATFVLKAKTNELMYDRYVKLAWHNKSALLDYNHLKTVEVDRNVTHGVILVDFPLATQHVGKFVYKYEDRNKFSKGTSSLVFNGESIMKANFTKSSSVSHLSFENIYNIHVENNYHPVGLVYLHNVTYFREGYSLPYLDKKVAEIYKLKNLTHKFIGELFVHKFENEENVEINAMHTIRKLSLVLKRGYKKVLETYGKLTLKPDVWAGYRLFLSNQNKLSSTGNNLEFNFAYPRRNVSLFGEYDMADKFIISNFGIISNDTSKSLSTVKEIRGSFNWHEQLKEYTYKISDKSSKSIAEVVRMYPVHYATFSVYHPSFKKNVTLTGEYSQNDIEFYNLKSTLEYSLDTKRKLSLSSVLEDKSSDNTKRYTFEAKATHPSSRLNLEMLGLHKRDSNVFEIVKNVSYSRSYLPLQYWNAHMRVSKLDKELELERESLRDLASLKGKYFGHDGVYKVNGSVIKGKDIRISGCFDADIPRKETGLIVNFTPDASERLHMEGYYRDSRNLFFKLWRVYDEDFINDASLFARLNHSRMLQSTLVWRPNIRNDLSSSAQSSWNYAWNYILQTFDFWTDYMKNEASDTVYDVWSDAKPVVQEFVEDLRVLKNVQSDIDYFTKVFNESYKGNEFYMKDAYNMYLFLAEEISFRDKMGNLPKIFTELWEIMGETGETIRQSIVWLIENVKELYSKALAFFSRLMRGEVLSEISHFITKMAGKYDKVIKDVHVSFIGYVEYLWYETATFLHNYWSTTLQVMEPTVIQLLHHLDYLVWEQSRKVFEFFNRSQQELLQSDYFAKNTNLTRDLEKFYKSVASNSFIGNVKNFAKMLLGMINDKIFSNIPFGFELGEIGKEIYGEVLELYKLPLINITVQTSQDVLERVMLVYTSFDIGGKVHRMIPVLYRHLTDLSRNALNNNIKNHPSKTLFIFDPENGIVKLEQKLPIPWHRFNETPNFSEIPEYKRLIELQQLFSPSNITFWSMYYHYIPFIDPINWLPPFKAHAIIIGSENFISFNKRHFSFPTRCSYLLAKDFVNNEFALILNYDPVIQSRSIVLLVDDETISVDLVQDSIAISSNQSVVLPVNLKCAYVYYEFGVVSIIGRKGFILECNLKHDICTLFLEGWFFGKTAGLLGTMDNEPYNDFLSSDGKIHSDVNKFAESWCLDLGCTSNKGVSYLKEAPDPEVEATCNMFFADKSSEFSVCFPVIDPAAFNDICKYSTDNEDSVCSAAVAYNQACTLVNIPLRTPFMCVKCPVANGSGVALKEGDFTELKDDDIPSSTDVVFIIESHACNSNLLEKRNFQSLITLLEEEFMLLGIMNNRYAVVAFGGTEIFSTPHTVTIDNVEFTNAKTVIKYFEYVSMTIGKEPGNSDIFSAISFASKQRFRPGVSKTFILVPCSDCDPRNMSLDYSVLHEVLTEKNAVLHILMNSEFHIEKSKISKILYGVDGDTAFTKNDVKAIDLKGDADLRRQIKLTKSTLGYCTPLAFETNGTIFSATKLEQENFSLVKKFLSVFTRRVAQTAAPPTCQTCECTANTNGIDYVDCFPCFFHTAIYSDGGYYKDNFTLSFFQSFDPLGGGSETETDISL